MHEIVSYLKSHDGYATMRQLRSTSFQTRDIHKWVEDGVLEKIKPGLYRLAEFSLTAPENFQLADVCRAYPKAVICLASALSYYELTTFNPHEIYVAIPMNERAPKIVYPPLRVYYFSKPAYEAGITAITHAAGTIRMYCVEKTICDMFRYRNKLGEDIAIEGLKAYMEKRPNINRLMEFAKVCRVTTIIKPYVTAMARQ
jgi:predicted transcriptional regulator of viral defense system